MLGRLIHSFKYLIDTAFKKCAISSDQEGELVPEMGLGLHHKNLSIIYYNNLAAEFVIYKRFKLTFFI